MPKIPPHVLRQLQAVLIPGMEMAVQSLVNELNQIRVATGQGADYRITLHGNPLGEESSPDQDAPSVRMALGGKIDTMGRRNRSFTPEGRANIAAAQKARWAKQKRNNFRSVPGAEILDFAKRHHGHFSIAKFKEANPKTHLRAIGMLIRNQELKQTSKGEYDLIKA